MTTEEILDGTGAAESMAEGVAAPQAAVALGSYAIASGYQVNVRSGPSTRSALVRVLPKGSRVQIRCQTRGETVSGPCGTTDIWDNIGPGQYVSDSYVKTGSGGFVAGRCS
ncbi:SH3 domain-containing protein [Streptomyces sp. AV19]|uniref:SH3 domain-containing protein n=1 Tax=Streptomyces sp. AV19 TaxID=2793068 RepID=UPI0018FE9F3D|nr:SH3 domain-containing protein [Streptomyces sp. AV19]MBH1934995.1 SH3 domain-containing protein [Streptomyces sp. AV19]MDG4534601.1 SH3 domain-containing protein [Streptomyces sp. AV19]